MNDYFLEFIKEPVSRGGLRDNNPFGVPLGARPKRNLADAYRQGADVFKQKLTQGELGPMFGPAQGLLQFATGQGITVGDESGTATISPANVIVTFVEAAEGIVPLVTFPLTGVEK